MESEQLSKKKSKWESDDSDNDNVNSEARSQKQKRSKKPKIAHTDETDSPSERVKAQLPLATPSPHTDRTTSSPPPSNNTPDAPTPTTQPAPSEANTPAPSSPARHIIRPAPPLQAPILAGCRHVDNYEKLNRIEEGAYGVVFRARDRATGDIVALKKLKLEKEKNGFPITSLREVHTLMLAKHPNIVNVREIVVGDKLDQIFIVMDFIEHDLKSLMEGMRTPFLQSEVKTIMLQLLSAVALLHDNWMIHRDLKTSNLLLNNRGEIKVADFGLARKYGSPLGSMTQLVVTLWYRAPELLLGAKEYSTAVDIWSIGCIFGELVNKEPLLPGRSELDQLDKIFKLLGMPNEKIWPGFSKLPHAQNLAFVNQPYNNLRGRFPYLTENGIDLLSRLLTYDPARRISAEEALKHPYFSEKPAPKDPSLFPTWPSKGSGEKKRTYVSPSAPQASHALDELDEEEQAFLGTIFDQHQTAESYGFRLKLG